MQFTLWLTAQAWTAWVSKMATAASYEICCLLGEEDFCPLPQRKVVGPAMAPTSYFALCLFCCLSWGGDWESSKEAINSPTPPGWAPPPAQFHLFPTFPHPNGPYCQLALLLCWPSISPLRGLSTNWCSPSIGSTFSPGAVNVIYSAFMTPRPGVHTDRWHYGPQNWALTSLIDCSGT